MPNLTARRHIAYINAHTPTTHTTDNSTVLEDIKTNTTLGSKININTNQVKLGSTSATSVIGGESTPVADDNDRTGWLFTKSIADTAKFNYYYYSQGNTAVTLADLTSLIAEVTIDNYQAINSIPFFVVYTKPTGVGDGGLWFHSKIAYTMDSDQKIILGESVRFYADDKPIEDELDRKRLIKCNTKIVTGTALDTEEILTISFHSDSGAGAGTQILVSNLGYSLYKTTNKIDIRTKLIV